MPSGFLLGGASSSSSSRSADGGTTSRSNVVTLRRRHDDSTSAVAASGKTASVTLRGGRRSSSSSSCEGVANKRNATYINDEEYDEDLAQLDVLLHYVNNLSASLEFLKWEDKRISTDLVPTLLNMYDALYARLSESPCATKEEQNENESNGLVGDREEESTEEKSEVLKGKLFIIEEDLHSHRNEVDKESSSLCNKCDTNITTKSNGEKEKVSSSCNCPSSTIETETHLGKGRLKIEHDYDIPEFIEKPPDDDEVHPEGKESINWSSKSKFLTSKMLSPSKEPSPILSSKRCRDLLYRPLSSISSSSSSSSSNSLPRGPASGLASYLASAESLEDSRVSETETSRRKDRGLKERRIKALGAGSDDSGVQCHIISMPVPPSIRPRYCDPNLNYMDRVVLEIVETEEIYVRDLKEVIEGYLQYWKYESDCSIAPDVAESLFSNVEEIFEFNRGFLRELELCGTDPVLVAKCFVRNNSGFAIYTEYCTNYPRTVSVLTDLMRGESSVKACRERQLSLGHPLPLGSYLLKPVQRVLKYHLLLGNIVKHFDKDRPGHAHIWNALSAMTGIAHHINDMKRKHEHAIRVQEIQSLLYGWQGEDLTTFGELAAEGAFRMFGVKGLRHVFLFDKFLLITKKKDENILVYKAHIMCSDLMLIESIPREPLSFHVIPFDNPKRQYTLECRNLEQKREWTLQLKRVILENYSATIPAHARQLVMELGQNTTKDLSALESRGGGRKAHSAPEYLEKRKDKRRASEGGFNSRLRIRRSSRTRKDKHEKENRSRSASRTRETDEDEDFKSNLLSPNSSSSTGEKSRLRLPMWRRRSEPGIRGRLSLPTSPSEVQPIISVRELSTNVETKDSQIKTFDDQPTLRLNADAECLNVSQYSECNSLYGGGDDNEEVAEENLEKIVSQLLQHQLQVQQKILNKQRRGLIRKKNINPQYETSDTENEDQDFESLPPLPKSPPPMLSPETMPFSTDYIDSLFKQTEKEWSSGTTSITSSNMSVNHQRNSFDSGPKSVSVSRSGSDIGSKSMNYENLGSIWNPSNKLSSLSRNEDSMLIRDCENVKEPNPLRRIHSFSNDLVLINNFSKVPTKKSYTNNERERPVTIVVYDEPTTRIESEVNSSIKMGNDTELCSLIYTKDSTYSVDNLVNIHPEHKIYSKPYKGGIKKILDRITNPRGTPNKTVSEPSRSLSNIYTTSDYEKSTRTSTNLVSSMARQYSNNLKERIKQIRTDDLDTPAKPVKEISSPQHCSTSVGARLATTNEAVEYAIPIIPSSGEVRPDSVLSSTSFWTSSSSSSSSNKEIKSDIFVEENDDEVPCSIASDLSGDSFYEKSFEAMEGYLEEDMFRDSAIYSEPEDSDGHPGLSPMVSFRSSLSAKTYLKNDLKPLNCSKNISLAFSKSFDGLLFSESPERTIEIDSRPSLISKKVPPPVPAKPNTSSINTLRPKGTLVQQQLKNLKESQKMTLETVNQKEFNGMKSLSERREQLQSFNSKITSKKLFDSKFTKRKKSLDSCLSISPSLGFSYSPHLRSSNILKDLCEDDEAMMSEGWVKHVVGKLQK